MNKSNIINIKDQFFSITLDLDNLNFVHSGCWNTECDNRINMKKLSPDYPFINTLLYDQLHITKIINNEPDIHFLSLIGDNIYQKYYEPIDMAPDKLIDKIPRGIACIEHPILLGVGNHDVDNEITLNAVRKLNERANIFMPNEYYCLIFKMKGFDFKMIYINGNILDTQENSEPYYKTLTKEQYAKLQDEQMAFIREAITSPAYKTKYTFVLGHEPIIITPHWKEEIILETKRPLLLEIERLMIDNNVDFYLNADEHNLQSVSSNFSKLKYITSGGGGALSDFPKALYDEKIKIKDMVLRNGKYTFNNVIASHGYVKFEITPDKIKYKFIVPSYVNDNLDNNINSLDRVFDQSFQVIATDEPITKLYIAPKLIMPKEEPKEGKTGGYYEKYLKYKQKYIKLKNLNRL